MLRAILISIVTACGQCIAEARECPDASSAAYYFEENALDQNPSSDAIMREWYSEVLRAMHEPSLSCGLVTATATYRFTWLRSFHHPIAIRVTRSESGAQLVGIELDGKGGFQPGSVLKTVSQTISAEEWNVLDKEFSKLFEFRLPDVRGEDGAEWIFEASVGGVHSVERIWSPSGGIGRELGMHLLELSGLSPPKDERD